MKTIKHQSSTLPHGSGREDFLRPISKLSYLLDESIRLPGGYRIGWDGIIGLIPGLGDVMGLGASGYILYLAAQGGVGKIILMRMAFNIMLETAIGSIPVIGDLFDFVFKANSRNLKLLQNYTAAPTQVRRVSAVWLALILLAVVAVFAGAAFAAIQLIRWLVDSAG